MGRPAVFAMPEDATADEIAGRIRRLANLKQYHGQIEVADFPAEAQELIKEQLKADTDSAGQSEKATAAQSDTDTAAPSEKDSAAPSEKDTADTEQGMASRTDTEPATA